MTLLEVKDLNVSFNTADGVVRAVRGVSFGVEPGRTLGIVGESGSGKTVLTQTLLGLTPGADVTGSALFEGTDLLLRLQADYGTALIMITHDLGVVADIADDVMVMYAGRAAEKAPKRDVFYVPHHPYTKGLLESIPSSSAAASRLRPIAGTPPSLINLPSGCKFHPRCGYVFDRCLTEEPPLRPVGETGLHSSACWLPTQAAGLSAEAEELREEAVLEQRGEEAAEVAAATAAELEHLGAADIAVPASEEGGA